MKRILLLTTGGTIASRLTDEGLAPGLDGENLARYLGGLPDSYDLTVRDILHLDSSNIQPEEWRLIARHVYAARDGFDGIVISHGTDTMAYTASVLSYMVRNIPIPVVLTGAQLPIEHPLTDGLDNLRTAFAMAASGRPGVFLAFDRRVMLGCRAVKTHTTAFGAFESVNWPLVARVDGAGLNLCHEVRDGILCHTAGRPADTLEGQLVRFADKIAYINHDIDDAMRGGVIFPTDIPAHISQTLGYTHGERIETLTLDIIRASGEGDAIRQSPPVAEAMAELKEFMFRSVYFNPLAKGEEGKAEDMICLLYEYYCRHEDKLPSEYQDILVREGRERAVLDYIAGMTDTYAVERFSSLFIPKGWVVK